MTLQFDHEPAHSAATISHGVLALPSTSAQSTVAEMQSFADVDATSAVNCPDVQVLQTVALEEFKNLPASQSWHAVAGLLS